MRRRSRSSRPRWGRSATPSRPPARDRYAAKVYTLLTVITDETDEAAQAKYRDYLSYASAEGALVLNSGWMGVDLSQYDLDEPLGNIESNAIQSTAANLSAATGEDGANWTVRDIAEHTAIGGSGRWPSGRGRPSPSG